MAAGGRIISKFYKSKRQGLVDHITVVDISKQVRDLATLADETKSSMDGVEAGFVVVATSELHSEHSQKLISNGYHVLVENR